MIAEVKSNKRQCLTIMNVNNATNQADTLLKGQEKDAVAHLVPKALLVEEIVIRENGLRLLVPPPCQIRIKNIIVRVAVVSIRITHQDDHHHPKMIAQFIANLIGFHPRLLKKDGVMPRIRTTATVARSIIQEGTLHPPLRPRCQMNGITVVRLHIDVLRENQEKEAVALLLLRKVVPVKPNATREDTPLLLHPL